MTMGPMSYGDWLRANGRTGDPETSAEYAQYARQWYEAKHNEAARFYSSTRTADDEPGGPPCMEIGGAQVYAYVRDGGLVVSVHLEGANGGVFALYGADRCVPVAVNVGDATVFEAGQAVESGAPVADALAEVDRRQNTSGQNGELTALRALAEAVRVSLIAFPEGDVRTLAVTAAELFDSADPDVLADLSARQAEIVDKAHKLFGEGSR